MQCEACKKTYTTVGNLNKHLKRQPLCDRWIRLRPGLKGYVEDAFEVQQQYDDQDGDDGECIEPRPVHPSCLACAKTFANAGNLTRHMNVSGICAKWAMYSALEPITMYARFEPPGENAGKMIHIIWNVFLVDKELVDSPAFPALVKSENVAHVVGVVKAEFAPRLAEISGGCGIGHTAVVYKGHTMDSIDAPAYESVCDTIETNRAERKNVVVFCTSGYQRSLPLLAYYLMNRHRDEAPTAERCVDLILPQVDKVNFAKDRSKYVELLGKLLQDS
jgi:hypothetical protein